MSSKFSFADSLSLSDLQVFLSRSARIDDGAVRLVADGVVLAAYVAVFHPVGLLDASPTVLGLRIYALSAPASFDAVVPLRAMTDRIVRLQNDSVDATAEVTVALPPTILSATWAAISPPRGGWLRRDSIDASVLTSVATRGIDEVAQLVPEGMGEQLVHRVRTEVWGKSLVGFDDIPAGAAFAALALGFLGEPDAAARAAPRLAIREVSIFGVGPWIRLSTERGHVLVKRRSASLLG